MQGYLKQKTNTRSTQTCFVMPDQEVFFKNWRKKRGWKSPSCAYIPRATCVVRGFTHDYYNSCSPAIYFLVKTTVYDAVKRDDKEICRHLCGKTEYCLFPGIFAIYTGKTYSPGDMT